MYKCFLFFFNEFCLVYSNGCGHLQARVFKLDDFKDYFFSSLYKLYRISDDLLISEQ